MPIPKDIQVNDISSNSFCVTWKIDDLNLLNIDKNKIKYKIELRKENEQKFESIYESKNNNHYLNKLESNINYEMRICSAYNDINSEYSDIIKIKTIDSILPNETKKCDECINKIFEWTGGKSMKLLYRGTRDGMSADKFHDKCDNKGTTICLFKNEKGYIFGGYASVDWKGKNDGYKSAPDSFIFTLTNIYNLSPTKFPNLNTSKSIYDSSMYGPCFDDIVIGFNSNSLNFPNYYKDVLGKGYSIFKGDNINNKFILKGIEVFQLIK